MRFLCLGEAMVEMAPTDDGRFTMGFAGDMLNTAWALRRICPQEWQIGFTTALGDDPLSGEMTQFMAAGGICTRDIRVLPGEICGLYLIRLRVGERSFCYWRGQSAARKMADDDAWLRRILDQANAVFLSGISLAILPEDRRAALVSALEHYGGSVFFDPNHRPRLWSGPELARDWLLRLAPRANILLPSKEDCDVLFGAANAETHLEKLAATGAREIVMTDGPGPIRAWHDGQVSQTVLQHDVQPVDTTGAGDAFNAGFLAARLQGQSLQQALQNGQALSQKVIATRGGLLQ